MDIAKRKRKIAECEKKLNDALRRQTIANTVVKRWRTRLKTQERALLKELETEVERRPLGVGRRQFLQEDLT